MKQFILTSVAAVRRQAREKRARIFRESFSLRPEMKILDVGSEDGTNMAALLHGTTVKPRNVYIADISEEVVKRGQANFGFTPVVIPENGPLPFAEGFFDIVYCSSVIEHVTVPKEEVWSLRSDREFQKKAWARQQEFARELRRIGKGYFIQTPWKWFPIESHTWLPFVGYLPRRVLVPLLWLTNRVWVKRTTPDWRLLSVREMRLLFPEAEIVRENFFGLTKSMMAIKRQEA